MHPIDLTIIISFLTAIIGYGIWQSRKNRTSADYFTAAKELPWLAAMFSIVATETSVLTFISIPGLAYNGSWFFLQLALGYVLGRILVSIFLLPQYFQSGITSIYEILGKKFGNEIQKTASLVFLITRILADGIRFLATAVIVQVITGWSITAAVLIIGLVTICYTLLGGIRTVIWVDSFQFLLYLSGAIISIVFIFMNLDEPAGVVIANLAEAGKFNIFQFDWYIFTNSWSFISALIGGMLFAFASHGVDYMMVQRVLVCRDLSAGRKAMIGSGIFVFIQFTVFLFVGSLIYVYFEGAAIDQDREFSTFIVNNLPIGLKGLLLAGVLSAAMSTLSSSINSLASSSVMDWFKERVSLNKSRWISLFWGVVLVGIALIFDESDSAIVIVGLKIASFTYGGLLGLFLLSKSSRNFQPASLIAGLVISFGIVFLLQYSGLAWTWFVMVSAITNILVTYVVNFFLEIYHK